MGKDALLKKSVTYKTADANTNVRNPGRFSNASQKNGYSQNIRE